jgi:hypothetical protein
MAALTASLREIDIRRESTDAQPSCTPETYDLEPLPGGYTTPVAHELASTANQPRRSAHLQQRLPQPATTNRTRGSLDAPLLTHSR